jgi:hypothetical protein
MYECWDDYYYEYYGCSYEEYYGYDDEWYSDYSDWYEDYCDVMMYEVECEFFECADEQHVYGEGTCWEEICYNECGEECMLWHAAGQDQYGEWEWISEPCGMSDEEMMEARSEKGIEFVMQFNDTFATAFGEFCPNGTCTRMAG